MFNDVVGTNKSLNFNFFELTPVVITIVDTVVLLVDNQQCGRLLDAELF